MSANSGRSKPRTRFNKERTPKPWDKRHKGEETPAHADPTPETPGGEGGPSIPTAAAMKHLMTRLRQGRLATSDLPAVLEFAQRVRKSRAGSNRDKLRACELIRAIAVDADAAAKTIIELDADMHAAPENLPAGTTTGEDEGGGVVVNINVT